MMKRTTLHRISLWTLKREEKLQGPRGGIRLSRLEMLSSSPNRVSKPVDANGFILAPDSIILPIVHGLLLLCGV
jgi:hypothetical protein